MSPVASAKRFFEILRQSGPREAMRRSWHAMQRLYYRVVYLPLHNLKGHRIFRVSKLDANSSLKLKNQEIKISIIMPTFNTPAKILSNAIDSIRAQSYGNWELCICDDFSDQQETINALRKYKGTDPRIKIIRSQKNLHIAGATNLALEFTTGDFVTFVDHDDQIAKEAIYRIVDAIIRYPDADILYTDEDKLFENGAHLEPNRKPSWSPDYLESVMYIMHLFVVRKNLLLKLGGLRSQFSGAQDYDLALRATRCARRIIHIPQILYHWRRIPGSAANNVGAKPTALRNAKAALEYHIKERDPHASVSDGLMPGSFRVNWTYPEDTEVTLLIPTNAQKADIEGKGSVLLIRNFIESILNRSTFKNYRILVVDNHNIDEADHRYIQEAGGKVIHYQFEGKFNFSSKINFSFDHVETEHVIILNDDMEVITPDWIESMLSFMCQDSVGAVGAKLHFPNGRIQHAGIVVNENADCIHDFYNVSQGDSIYFGYANFVRNYPAVTGAAMGTKMSLVKRLGGFREELATDYNDVDFCLRLLALGFRNVYTPYASLYHFENSTIKRKAATTNETMFFKSLWEGKISDETGLAGS
jgi:glycosyltransferase involved in cell wall biosynthesis